MGLGKWFKAATNILSNPVQLITIAAAAYTGQWYAVAAIAASTYGNYQTIRMEEKQKAQEQAAKDAYNNSLQDRLINVLTTEAPYQVIYGQTRIGGAIAAVLKSGDKDQYRHIVCVHAAHEVEEIGEIFVGETSLGTLDADGNCTTGKYANQVRVKKHLGKPDEAADASLISECPDKWTSDHLLRGFAYTVVRIDLNQADFQSGIPQINAVIKGKKLLDVRTGVIAWSDNPALCIYDFLVSKYGMNQPTDNMVLQSFKDAADDCDEIINVGKRYTCNGSFKTDQDPKQTLNSLADSMAGSITESGGWSINAGVYKNPVMALTEDDLVGGIQVIPSSSMLELFNSVNGQFSNPEKAYVVTDFTPYKNSTFITEDGAEYFTDFTLHYTNSNQRCQNIARIVVERARQGLVITMPCSLKAWKLQCGDRVTVTNATFGWTNKVFRVVQWSFNINAPVELTLQEDGATVYDEADAVVADEFPNTGLQDPFFFGDVQAPVVVSSSPNASIPTISLQVTTSSLGIVQYAEVYYSAQSSPSLDQMIFAGTTESTASNSPYTNNQVMPIVTLGSIPAGQWYFFVRMVNSVSKSRFSPASSLFTWKPTTIQFAHRWLVVAYADNATGTSGFDTNPRNKSYYGLSNQTSSTPVNDPSAYTWYAANPTFGTTNYLLYTNRTGRRFSFATGNAAYAGAFVPTETGVYDPSIWSGLPDETNYIDLDRRTGQVTETGTTSTGLNSGEISVRNNADGRLTAALAPVPALQALSGGAGTYTATVAKLTIDIYGRVLGFEPPDDFKYTTEQFNASSGQTVFTVTRGSDYLIDNCFVFRNGVLLDESEYTDTGGSTGTVTLGTGAVSGDIITIISMKSVNLVSGSYNSFTREIVDLTDASSYTASGFTLVSGYELLFLNGTVVNDQDYDIVGQTINGFPALVTGRLTIIQWSNSNLDIPNGTPINQVTNSVIGQDTYPFSYVANALNIYQNGVLLDEATDYTTGFGEYTLSNTPVDVNQILLQQTFNRTGAV